MGNIGAFFSTLFGPIGQIFHVVFYLPIYNVLMLLYEGVHHIAPGLPAVAIAIFLLTIIVRLCLFPLTKKQLSSSRKMQELAPQLQEIKRRIPNPQEQMAATQALYREHGVSMYGGCLPLLIQMPFLYGLYYSLYTALLANKGETAAHHLGRINGDIYPFLPHLTTLPSTHFLWTSLATPDPLHILPVLAGVLTFIQLRMANPVRAKTGGTKQSDPNSQAMGTMQFVMPFFTFFIGLNFPAGLAFYWTISTAFSAVQQYFLTGWGSLFVGIPGMEHLVPEPTTPTPISAGRPRAASAIVDSSSAPARPTGMAGLRQLLADMAAGRAQPAEQQSQAEVTSPPARAGGTQTAKKANAAGAAAAVTNAENGHAPAGGPRPEADGSARRQRTVRQGPTLVKPVTSSSSTALSGNGAATSANGAAKQADSGDGAAAGSSGTGALQAVGTVGPAAGSSQRNSSSSNGTRAPRPAQSTSSTQRKPAGGSAARKRPNGKPKGGR